MAITNELKDMVREIVEAECCKDENGMYYSEIYADHRHELSDGTILKICKSACPQETFDEIVTEMFQDCEWDYEDELRKKILEEDDIRNAIESETLTEDEITDYLREIYYVKISFDHFLRQNIYVDILVDAGDLNMDYTLNTPVPNFYGFQYGQKRADDNSGILWLTRQQGYKKSELNDALRNRNFKGTDFLKTLYNEVENCTSPMNVLTFLVQMEFREWFKLHRAIQKEKKLNRSHTPAERKGRGYIILDKKTTCGLYDPWNGADSSLEIKLDKDVRLPIRLIDSALTDGGRGYSISEIRGSYHSEWTADGIKEIHEQKKVA